jgi:prevent-host-death family protein
MSYRSRDWYEPKHLSEIVRACAEVLELDARTEKIAVSPGSTRCYHYPVDAHPEITQRDLRTRSREIMDAVEHGQSFTVTRDGHRIAELVPLRQRRRFVPRQEFATMSRNAPAVDLEAFRADQDAALDHQTGSAYER